MKITADTNVLVRALTEDHAEQSKAAQLALGKAEIVALAIPTLCELVWVLRGYKIAHGDIAMAMRRLLNGRRRRLAWLCWTRAAILRMARLLTKESGLAPIHLFLLTKRLLR
jgi:predicted nucleic-acid-binding protein